MTWYSAEFMHATIAKDIVMQTYIDVAAIVVIKSRNLTIVYLAELPGFLETV